MALLGMRVGELLLERGLVDWETLALAIGDQLTDGRGLRLCSFLIARGVISFDQAARVLGEQHGSAAALRRHLEGRDPDLAALLPEDVARQLVALPIGRLGNGSLIVAVRDPSLAVHARLRRILGEEPVLAVAPAHYLERLVVAAYAPHELDAGDLEDEDEEGDFELPIEVEEPAPDVDFVIDVEMPAPKPKKQRALSIVIPVMAATQTKPDSLDATLTAFRDIDEPNWLFDVAMKYISARWRASLLLAINDRRAVGVRGHGQRMTPTAVKTCVVDIADVTLVEKARDERRIIDEAPGDLGPEHEVVDRLIGGRGCPIAAPLLRGETVSHVLLLGEPVSGEREDALVDLGLLVEAMSEALSRM